MIEAKKSGRILLPESCRSFEGLLLIEFYSIAHVNRFQREYDHSGRSGRRCAKNHNFANTSARHIVGMNHWAVTSIQHGWIDHWRLVLCHFIRIRSKGKRVDWVSCDRSA